MPYNPIIHQNLSKNLKDNLRQYILKMDLTVSRKLPSEVDIGKLFGVSRITVRRALDELEQEGVIRRIHGRGTFVNPAAARIKINLSENVELSRLVRDCGYDVEQELLGLGTVKAPALAQDALHITSEEDMYYIIRGFRADGRMAILCVDILRKDFLPEDFSTESFKTSSTFDVIRDYTGQLLVSEKTELKSITTAEAGTLLADARLFSCETLLELKGVYYTESGASPLLAAVFYDTSIIRFSLMRTVRLF